MRALHIRRLLNVVRALEESPNPDKFTMKRFGHECGSPACALGHYCSRPDLQSAFLLSRHAEDAACWPAPTDDVTACLGIDNIEICAHFGLTADEAMDLFDENGCGGAQTALEAAKYIRDFVSRKEDEAYV